MNPPSNMSHITPQPYVTSTPYQNIEQDLENRPSTSNLETSLGTTSEQKDEKPTTKLSTILRPHWSSTVPDSTAINFSTVDKSTTASITSSSTSAKTTVDSETTVSALGTRFSSKMTTTTRKPTSRVSARSSSLKNKAKKQGAVRSSRPTQPGGNMTGQSLPLSLNSLADLDHPENLNLEFNPNEGYRNITITLEYLNYAMALGVYSVRYPAVFWSCNKALGTIFSLQLVVNSAQSLLAYTGMSVLYKVQVVGSFKVLPFLRHRTITTATTTISKIFGHSFFLLNPHVTLGLFALSSLLVLCSSMVMYLYAHGRDKLHKRSEDPQRR